MDSNARTYLNSRLYSSYKIMEEPCKWVEMQENRIRILTICRGKVNGDANTKIQVYLILKTGPHKLDVHNSSDTFWMGIVTPTNKRQSQKLTADRNKRPALAKRSSDGNKSAPLNKNICM